MITNLKVQIEEDKRIEKALKELLEDWLLSLMSTLVMGFGPQD
jgi:hypothetical protein